eukprot:TRINITY_DN29511_c0_g1_i1.p1 TRINITY_DN29511_c0_g1~~TRINITY_DN29511_c0_g1_i1.p1  ORF type:complete len:226 (-),score=49.57 TRINITY_DN29511_c0_g1_i1:39-653(-)
MAECPVCDGTGLLAAGIVEDACPLCDLAEVMSSATGDASMAVETTCTLALERAGVAFARHPVKYEDVKDGESLLASFARQSGGNIQQTVKTMVFDVGQPEPALVLMSHDWKVDSKKLAEKFSVAAKKVRTCSQDRATECTGYQFGGTTPIGVVRKMPIVAQEELQKEELIFINGGSRELVISLLRQDLEQIVGGISYWDVAKRE